MSHRKKETQQIIYSSEYVSKVSCLYTQASAKFFKGHDNYINSS